MNYNFSVLLDTSFFIRLLNKYDPLHGNAKDYFKFFLENGIKLKISTISIAEYCVGGDFSDLPLKNLQILPFNYDHAIRTGEFARIMFNNYKNIKIPVEPRAIIPNDAKLFAQADIDPAISYFVTSDTRTINKTRKLLNHGLKIGFKIIDIHQPYNKQFGLLDL